MGGALSGVLVDLVRFNGWLYSTNPTLPGPRGTGLFGVAASPVISGWRLIDRLGKVDIAWVAALRTSYALSVLPLLVLAAALWYAAWALRRAAHS